MKNIKFFALLAGVGLLAASCAKEEHVIFDPSQTVNPTIGTVTDAVLTAESEDIVIEFGSASFTITAPVTYALQISTAETFETFLKVAASFDEEAGTATVSAANLNKALLNLGGVVDTPLTVYFRIAGALANDKGAATGAVVYSEIISAALTPYSMLIIDKDTYTYVHVQGNYAGWSWDKCQFLYDYNKDGATYEGVIDFGSKAANGVKFAIPNNGDWDEKANWGSQAQGEEAEQATINLKCAGDSKDIKCWSKRFYHLTLNTTAPSVKVDWSADEIGLCGTFNSWTLADATPMNYNADFVRFWIDMTFEDGAKFKFVADKAWDTSWGKDCGKDDIVVETGGNYRVYLDLNKKIVDLDATMYGKDEPTASGGSGGGEEAFEGWSLIGSIGGDTWATDIDFTSHCGDLWAFRGVAIAAGEVFKIRKDHAWGDSFGGIAPTGEDTFSPTIGTAFPTGTNDIKITAAGTYDIILDTTEGHETILVKEHVAGGWSLIGNVNGTAWNWDYEMTENSSVWTSEAVYIKGEGDTGEFKIRYDYGWDTSYGVVTKGSKPTLGAAFAAGGENIILDEGWYIVSLDLTDSSAPMITITATTDPGE